VDILRESTITRPLVVDGIGEGGAVDVDSRRVLNVNATSSCGCATTGFGGTNPVAGDDAGNYSHGRLGRGSRGAARDANASSATLRTVVADGTVNQS
jgi:hypothetical protein